MSFYGWLKNAFIGGIYTIPPQLVTAMIVYCNLRGMIEEVNEMTSQNVFFSMDFWLKVFLDATEEFCQKTFHPGYFVEGHLLNGTMYGYPSLTCIEYLRLAIVGFRTEIGMRAQNPRWIGKLVPEQMDVCTYIYSDDWRISLIIIIIIHYYSLYYSLGRRRRTDLSNFLFASPHRETIVVWLTHINHGRQPP